MPDLGDPADAVRALLASGELESGEVEGERYLWPPAWPHAEPPRTVRFLAPFDPLVWDRRRFAIAVGLGIPIRSLYTAAERQLGYYALPLLWGEHVIGWANASVVDGTVQVASGFVGAAPKGYDFRGALDSEIARLTTFLRPR